MVDVLETKLPNVARTVLPRPHVQVSRKMKTRDWDSAGSCQEFNRTSGSAHASTDTNCWYQEWERLHRSHFVNKDSLPPASGSSIVQSGYNKYHENLITKNSKNNFKQQVPFSIYILLSFYGPWVHVQS